MLAASVAIWTGYSDEEEEGVWKNVNTGNRLGSAPDTYSAWNDISGEPNGGVVESCASVGFTDNYWNDMPCDFNLCFFCNIPKYPFFKIRGKKIIFGGLFASK